MRNMESFVFLPDDACLYCITIGKNDSILSVVPERFFRNICRCASLSKYAALHASVTATYSLLQRNASAKAMVRASEAPSSVSATYFFPHSTFARIASSATIFLSTDKPERVAGLEQAMSTQQKANSSNIFKANPPMIERVH